jgi:hypothetical protein
VLQVALRRERGNPVEVRTIDLGTSGMRVVSPRPLAVDEVMHFDLDLPDEPPHHLDGQVRVVREHGPNVYGLRLEALPEHARSALVHFVAWRNP